MNEQLTSYILLIFCLHPVDATARFMYNYRNAEKKKERFRVCRETLIFVMNRLEFLFEGVL